MGVAFLLVLQPRNISMGEKQGLMRFEGFSALLVLKFVYTGSWEKYTLVVLEKLKV